jgi:hypothetical protein
MNEKKAIKEAQTRLGVDSHKTISIIEALKRKLFIIRMGFYSRDYLLAVVKVDKETKIELLYKPGGFGRWFITSLQVICDQDNRIIIKWNVLNFFYFFSKLEKREWQYKAVIDSSDGKIVSLRSRKI